MCLIVHLLCWLELALFFYSVYLFRFKNIFSAIDSTCVPICLMHRGLRRLSEFKNHKILYIPALCTYRCILHSRVSTLEPLSCISSINNSNTCAASRLHAPPTVHHPVMIVTLRLRQQQIDCRGDVVETGPHMFPDTSHP